MKKRVVVLLSFVFLILIGLFNVVTTQSNFKINSVVDHLNYEYKPVIQSKAIKKATFQNRIDTKLFKGYQLNIEVKEMEYTHIFFAYFSTINPENMENITAVNTNIDEQNKIITINTYINTKYPFSKSEVQTIVNQSVVTGLLHAQSLLENKQINAELRAQIYGNTELIYKKIEKTNDLWIVYE